MALIHEKLYQSKDLSRIDLADYIRRLVDTLFRSYGVDSESVTLKIEISNAPLAVDTAVPCGLIISELVSNSLKYAFPKGRRGEVRINLCSPEDRKIALTVGDNGIGFPEDLDFRNTESLGLQLVSTLTD
jgi:two-component sensor histidine kinase